MTTNNNTLLDKYLKIEKSRADFISENKDALQAELASSIASLLRETDKYDEVCWTQYTPYFNDGDACYFSVHDPYFVTGKKRMYDYHFGDNDVEGKVLSKIGKLILNFPENLIEKMFGDHAEVHVNKKGEVYVGHCEHD